MTIVIHFIYITRLLIINYIILLHYRHGVRQGKSWKREKDRKIARRFLLNNVGKCQIKSYENDGRCVFAMENKKKDI